MQVMVGKYTMLETVVPLICSSLFIQPTLLSASVTTLSQSEPAPLQLLGAVAAK